MRLKALAVLLIIGSAGACADRRARSETAASDSARTDTARTDTARADAGSAVATDDCVRGEPEAALEGSRVTSRFQRTGRLAATEDAQLDDTTSLRIMHGGCAHYVESYTFVVRGAVRDTTDTDYWLSRAVVYLRALGVVERRASQIDQMVTALETAAAKADPYAYGEPLSVPEFTTISCTVRRGAPGSVVVEIVYDVAL